MDLKCEYLGCESIYCWTGRGRHPHYCIPHRIQLNRKRAIEWHKSHYRSKSIRLSTQQSQVDPESIVRPLVSHKFSGPGLFEPLPTLLNRALTVKAHTLDMPKSFVEKSWIYGQAGQQFMKSFLHPELF